MSAVIKTPTPFVMEEILIQALEAVGAEPEKVTGNIPGNQRNRILPGDILTNRSDYNGRQLFREQNNRWVLMHDSDELSTRIISTSLTDKRYKPVAQFLSDLSLAYNLAYGQHLERIAEQERIRLEEERKARVEATKQKAIEKAKAQGYSVKETRKGNQIQLVLVRTV